MENWLQIIESPNYEISDEGRVKNSVTQKILSAGRNTRGYLQVGLQGKTFRVHRLVARYFVENPNLHREVNHKDGNKLNNIYTNLEWCSRSYNLHHAYVQGLRIPSHKARVAKCNLEGNILEEYESVSAAARANNLPISSVQVVAKQRLEKGKYTRKTAGGYRWKFI